MIHLNAIPYDFAPQQHMLSKLSKHVRSFDSLILMSQYDFAFLCGALKTFRPKKILEVGVAAGASTAIILQTLEEIGEPYEMHSIDVANKQEHYGNATSGFLATIAKERIFGKMSGTHKFHLGKILPQIIDEIGGGIDFVLLDTMHSLPGEVLDFLAALPYLTNNAIVVLHDVSLHQFEDPNNFLAVVPQITNNEVIALHDISHQSDASKENATGVLFSAVTAEKFLNFQPDEELFRYPNIAAFKVNEQTAANIENIFLSLILRWNYWPTDEQVKIYRQHYRRFYADALCEIFQEAVDMNAYNFVKAQNE